MVGDRGRDTPFMAQSGEWDLPSEGCAAAAASIETAILTATGRSDGRGGEGMEGRQREPLVLLGEALRGLTTRRRFSTRGLKGR